jgi:hypothetical protein
VSTAGREQRKHPRAKSEKPQNLKVSFDPGSGTAVEVPVGLVDSNDEGIGVELAVPLVLGSFVTIMGPLAIGGCRTDFTGRARVRWCKMTREGAYRAGLYLEDAASHSSGKADPVHAESPSAVDYYEVLEVSPKASPDTIHRIYRILAQRYHPDNAETGNEEAFKDLLAAYRVLSAPEQRAAYDVQRQANRHTRWKIFEQVEAGRGPEAEKRKRQGILALLYTKRVNDPDQPGMTLYELEDLLSCPREHLSFSLWYLKENNYILRGDNARVSITARGVDQAEEPVPWNQREDRLLAPAPTPSPAAARS